VKLELPDLPYDYNALEPHISARTLEFHHDKHHNTYVQKAQALVKDTPREGQEVEALVTEAAKNPEMKGLFNNAAQVWNHTFLWQSMAPSGGGKPSGDLAKRIDSDLGGYDKFVEQFSAAAANQFGSGWAWLVYDGSKLQVYGTLNADTPMVSGHTALLTLDVWEHAYYLDYQNRRPDYIKAFVENLLNWDFASRNLAQVV